MEKLLGFRLLDSIKEVAELENLKMQLLSALYVKKVEKKIENNLEALSKNLEGQAIVYGVKIDNYSEKVNQIKQKYLSEIEKVKTEYSIQFINMQLELRETLANQKIAIANAKKCADLKKEYINSTQKKLNDLSGSQIIEFQVKVNSYENNKEKYLRKYYNYSSIVKDCEIKIERCMQETLDKIENISNKVIEKAILVKKENTITKIITKISNLFTGKSKFENKVLEIEQKIQEENLECEKAAEEIRDNTINLVADIQNKKDNLKLTASI